VPSKARGGDRLRSAPPSILAALQLRIAAGGWAYLQHIYCNCIGTGQRLGVATYLLRPAVVVAHTRCPLSSRAPVAVHVKHLPQMTGTEVGDKRACCSVPAGATLAPGGKRSIKAAWSGARSEYR
jgi:hypothetical protein